MKRAILLAIVYPAFALAQNYGDKKQEHFQDFKQAFQKRIQEEKNVLDAFSNCVSSAQNHENLEKCRETKEASMKKMHEERKEERRKHLQDELKKLDSEKHD